MFLAMIIGWVNIKIMGKVRLTSYHHMIWASWSRESVLIALRIGLNRPAIRYSMARNKITDAKGKNPID